MKPLREYNIKLTNLEMERIHNATNVLHGVAALRSSLADEEERPAWWSNYHESTLNAALECASDVLGSIVDKIQDQQIDADNERGES
ncbi:hypothetical protein [Salinisphaera hydrothermalis]|uniref:hypothetical protein n=1 Tax=Salinisphaera hydrothermalis TaxID=563188 RepID=UPI00333F282F